MPDGLRQFAEANPFTTISDAVRSLWLGTPAEHGRLDVVRLVRRADGGLRAARRGPLPEGRRRSRVAIIWQVTPRASARSPTTRGRSTPTRRVVTFVAESLAPSVANLRVGRRGGGSGVVDHARRLRAHQRARRRRRAARRACVASFTDGRELSRRARRRRSADRPRAAAHRGRARSCPPSSATRRRCASASSSWRSATRTASPARSPRASCPRSGARCRSATATRGA